MEDFKKLFKYLGPYKRDLILASLFVSIECAFELVIPSLIADLIDYGVALKDTRYLLLKGSEMMAYGILALITGLLYARFSARAAYGWGANIRKEEYKRIQEYSFTNIDHFETSSLITRLTSDITVVQNSINGGLRPLIRSPLMFILGIAFSFTLNRELAIVFLVLAPTLGIILFTIVRKVAPMFGRLQKSLDSLNSTIEENIRAIRTVKSFTREDEEERKFDAVNSALREKGASTNSTATLNLPIFQSVMFLCILLLMAIGGKMIIDGKMMVGTLTGFLSYVMQVLNSMMMLSNVFLLLTRSLSSAKRIDEVLSEEIELEERKDPVTEVKDGSVEFKSVSFKYSKSAKEYTLKDISLTIKEGETVGILGTTGSGKSSFAQLIERLYDVSEGEILIGGVNVKDYSIKTLRDEVGIILQKNLLFSGTIRENLLWGDENASDIELFDALRTAGAYEFVTSFSNSLDHYIEQGGVNLSGGQRQRLCIARTLLKRPKIIIFDDSTSAVDTETEKRIRENLSRLSATKIYIAQRITTVISADKIIILDDGKVKGIGKHDELLKNSEIYREIYSSQLKGGTL